MKKNMVRPQGGQSGASRPTKGKPEGSRRAPWTGSIRQTKAGTWEARFTTPGGVRLALTVREGGPHALTSALRLAALVCAESGAIKAGRAGA